MYEIASQRFHTFSGKYMVQVNTSSFTLYLIEAQYKDFNIQFIHSGLCLVYALWVLIPLIRTDSRNATLQRVQIDSRGLLRVPCKTCHVFEFQLVLCRTRGLPFYPALCQMKDFQSAFLFNLIILSVHFIIS